MARQGSDRDPTSASVHTGYRVNAIAGCVPYRLPDVELAFAGEALPVRNKTRPLPESEASDEGRDGNRFAISGRPENTRAERSSDSAPASSSIGHTNQPMLKQIANDSDR